MLKKSLHSSGCVESGWSEKCLGKLKMLSRVDSLLKSSPHTIKTLKCFQFAGANLMTFFTVIFIPPLSCYQCSCVMAHENGSTLQRKIISTIPAQFNIISLSWQIEIIISLSFPFFILCIQKKAADDVGRRNWMNFFSAS